MQSMRRARYQRHAYARTRLPECRPRMQRLQCADTRAPAILRGLPMTLERETYGQRYVYLRSEPGLFTVGFYDPSGKWHAESDHSVREDAAARVNYLNGGNRA